MSMNFTNLYEATADDTFVIISNPSKEEYEASDEYEQQAYDFCCKYGVTVKVRFLKTDFCSWDEKHQHDQWEFHISKNGKWFKINFTDSLKNSCDKTYKGPTVYDLLACAQKHDVGSYENFCDEFGYDKDPYLRYENSKEYHRQRNTWHACLKEYANWVKLFEEFSSENEQLWNDFQEIA